MAETIHLTVQSQPPVGLTTEQARVIRAVSPTIDAERVEGGVQITVEDYREEPQTVVVYDGQTGPQGPEGPAGEDGADGQPGQDGVSPTVAVESITGGHEVTITDAEGAHTFDVMDGTTPTVPVTDVQVNGTSVVSEGVANVPLASSSVAGVAKTSEIYGTYIDDGIIKLSRAPSTAIKSGTGIFKPLTPDLQHNAAFYGLAKAAGADMKDIASTTVGTYPEAQKSAISTMLSGPVSVSGTTPVITALPGIRYVCGEVSTLDITLPASGCIDVVFVSGSTPTVLTVTPPTGVTLKWTGGFDPTSLDANTTYEINIADGLGVAASWT